MQKNWYIIYTKPKCEKKVAGLLTKRKIEAFCPLNCKQINRLRKSKLVYEPLFDSYVFIKIMENEIPLILDIENIVSLVYWKNQPAIINDLEIQALKEFTSDYQDIKLERTKVNIHVEKINNEGSSYIIEGKILLMKNRTFKVNLPSVGFTLVAEMESISQVEIAFGNKELMLQ